MDRVFQLREISGRLVEERKSHRVMSIRNRESHRIMKQPSRGRKGRLEENHGSDGSRAPNPVPVVK